MGIFSDHNLEQTVKIQAEIIQSLDRKNDHLTKELIHCLKHCHHDKPHPVKLSIIFYNNTNPSTMSLELKSGQTSIGTLIVTDTVTGQPVSATFTNLSAVSDSPGVASVTPNADGTITATGVSSGTANASISAIAAFTNSLGNSDSQSLSVVEALTVDSVPVANPVSLSVSWSTPA